MRFAFDAETERGLIRINRLPSEAEPSEGAGREQAFRLRPDLTARERRVLLRVDRGEFHCLPEEMLGLPASAVRGLEERRFLKLLPARGRWKKRYVVTSAGHTALGTFDHDQM